MDRATPSSTHSAEELRRAKQHARALMSDVEGCRGVGIGDGTVRLHVREASVGRDLPAQIDGVPVELVVVGEITTY